MSGRGGALRGLFALLFAVTLISGCAESKDGLGLGSNPPERLRSGVLVIGTIGPLRKPTDKQRDAFYEAYAKAAAQSHAVVSPVLSAAEFGERLAGWASIQTSALQLVASRRVRVLVPATLPQDTRFAAEAGDLVAARGDRDGIVWVDRVLCRNNDAFKECAEKYQAGLFDENTGRELSRDRKPKADGALVDVTSYVSLSIEAARHTASELDPRALNRCDGCKGSLPASPQSVVPVP